MTRRAPLVAAALAIVACGGKGARSPAIEETRPTTLPKKAAPSSPVTGWVVASVGDRVEGPFLARHVDGPGGLVAWVTAGEGHGRRVAAVPLAPSGEPRSGEKTLAHVAIDTTMLVVRPMHGPAPGFVVAWTSLNDRGESLYAIAAGEDGSPRGRPLELARSGDDIVWVDVVPTALGAVCLWAEETRGGDANVVAASLDTDGKVRGVPSRVATGVTGWHALELPRGVGLSTVAAAPRAKGGALSFQRLDVEGRAEGAAVVIAPKPTVSGDVEVVRDRTRLVFAWTDRTGDEPAISAAALGDDGAIDPPRRILERRGGAGLLRLASGAAGPALLWESPLLRADRDARMLYLSRIGPGLVPTGRATALESVGRALPELAAVGAGFAVAAPVRGCDVDPTCPVVASLARVGEDLAVLQREALDFSGDPASMAWGLSCGQDACFTLAASGAAPTRVRTVAIAARANVAAPPPSAPAPPGDAPRVTEISAISSGESVADLAALRLGDATLLATLSVKLDERRLLAAIAGRGPRLTEPEPPLTLSTRVIDAAGGPSAPVVISTRALAVGGVAIAPAGRPEDGGALAWVARDNGDPEVHVTRIDNKGRRTNDVQLTTTRGDAGDVTITWADGGWIVAWVDGRDGNGEVYATKVGLDLSRVAREERITRAPGDASDLFAMPRGDLVWLAWADPRESPKDGMADVWVTAVRTRDAKRAVDETRVLATAPHSRSPRLAHAEGGVQIAWVEEAPMGLETPGASGHGAMVATLDANGKPIAAPARVPAGGEGAAISVAFDGQRAIVARSTPDAIALDAVVLGPAPRAFSVLTLDGPPSLDVALVLDDGVLFFNDDGPTPSAKRARRARIDWRASPR